MRTWTWPSAVLSTTVALLLAALVAACTVVAPPGTQAPTQTAPPTTPQPTPTQPTFDTADVDATIAAFAAAGIEVRVRPADAPLVAAGQPSRLGLLRFQARNLALEVRMGSGTTGAELGRLMANGRREG